MGLAADDLQGHRYFRLRNLRRRLASGDLGHDLRLRNAASVA
jgi:hypothetical protein